MQKEDKIKLISLVVPAYKQQKTILKNVEVLMDELSKLPYKSELLIVIDGNLDNTSQKLEKLKKKNIFVYQYERNEGKGYAVRYGVLRAKGDLIGFIDAGMDLDPSEISLMIDTMLWKDADVVVGSKLHPDSKVNYPYVRKILSWGYRTFTHLLFGFSVRDTQVGLKFFRRQVAKDVFPRLLVKRFAFDVEVLALAYALGYKKIYESPVKLRFRNNSTITSKSFWKEISNMLWDTAAVFYRVRILKYYRRSNKENWLNIE